MWDEGKTKEQLLVELRRLREQVARLEKSQAEPPDGQSLAWAHLYRFYTILSSLHAAVLLVTEEGRVEFANQAFCDLFELTESPDALRGLSPWAMIEKIRDRYADPLEAVHRIEEIVRLGSPVKGEEVALRKGRTCLRDFIPLCVDGKRYGRVWHHQDITERKSAEAELALSEERFRKLFEESPIGIALLGKEREYLLTNRCFQDFVGYSEAEVMERGPVGLMHPDDWEPSMALSARLRSGEIPLFHREQKYIRKDGSTVCADTHIVVLRDSDDQLIHTIAWVQDITEAKRAQEEKEKLEAQLRQAQKLEAIGALAGGIAHDFNNILAPIIGYTEMVMGDLPQSSPILSDLEQVLRAAHRARELVKQILAFSRNGEDQKRAPVDLGSIVKEALQLMRASLPSSIEIRESIQRGVALADPTQIHQVLVNLCTNASHAMEDKGVLGVSLSNVNLSESDLTRLSSTDLKPGAYLKLSVTDTGHGMDEQTIQRVFDPYFTTKGVGKGTGLGLAVAHGIVKRNEGAITVQSDPGKGTTFDVYLPRVELESVAQRRSRDLPRGSERILLLDDEQMVADLGTRMLTQLGYKVTRETNVVNALDTFSRSPAEFDLIITDYTMPHMTGTELAGEVLKIRPGMPIILCTGYSEKGTETAARELGIRGYALKPLDRAQLAHLVRQVLDEDERE